MNCILQKWTVLLINMSSLRQNETKTDFFDKTLQIKPAPITGTEAANYDKLIGDYGFGDFGYAIKVFKNGVLLRTFIQKDKISEGYRPIHTSC